MPGRRDEARGLAAEPLDRRPRPRPGLRTGASGGGVLAVLAYRDRLAAARAVRAPEPRHPGEDGAADLAERPREDHRRDGGRQRAGPVRAGLDLDAADAGLGAARRLERGGRRLEAAPAGLGTVLDR